MSDHQIDWRREFARLAPYFRGRGGVIHIRFRSPDCAPNRFNSVLKKRFQAGLGNAERASVRINPADWFTTLTPDDMLDQIERKIDPADSLAERSASRPAGSFLSGMDAGRDINITIADSALGSSAMKTASERKARVDVICRSLRDNLEAGRRVLIEVNDSPLREQGSFWGLWRAGLADLVGAGLVLIYMIGPEGNYRAHEDSPKPDEEINLPQSFETEDDRQDHVYDDLIDIFMDSGLSNDAASALAAGHLRTTKTSVSRLHDELAGVLMDLKRREAERG